jgi:histidinol-phosphate/aromatic aminotransferase/cobyric acid decarboxylase-like protein
MRERLVAEGYDPAPSDAPFLLIDVADRSATAVVEGVREEGIAVRDCRSFGLENHVRVAIRTRADNDRLLEALADV